MFSKNAFGLLGLTSLFGLVAACSGAPAPTGTGQPEQTEGSTLPPVTASKDGNKTPSTNGGNNQTPPATNTPNNPNPNQPGGQGDPGDPGGQGEPGQAGRVSVNEHCCYGGTYYKCPDSNACFGGYDVNACLSTCAGPFDPCFEECFDKLSNAGPPKGCQTNVTPPAGVDCKNGNINVN